MHSTMFLRIVLSSLLVLGALLTWQFGGTRERPADFRYVNPSDIHTLDPARMSWTQDLRVALNIWEGLTAYDPRTLEPIGGAAGFPPQVSADGLTWTFVLRDDARWSNGESVTADDFIRGWRRCLEPGTGTDYAFLLTDHVDRAGEYVEWRREGIAFLTALAHLAEGRPIRVEDARAIHASRTGDRVLLGREVAALLDDPAAADDAALARALAAMRVDWRKVHAEVLTAHAGQMEARFARVGLSARDPRTLVVRLARPCPYLLDLTAFPVLSPIHVSIERLRERHEESGVTAEGLVVYDAQWTKPDYHARGYPGLITNGPYTLADWRFKRRARLVVNPCYRGAVSIAARTIDMIVIEDGNTALLAYEAGDVDFLPGVEVPYEHELVQRARSGDRPDFHLTPLLATYFLNFNCATETVDGAMNPFLDGRVRAAFALTIDRRAIVEQVLARGDVVATSLVPPGGIPGYRPPRGRAMDVPEARRLLSEAGFAGGAGLPPITLLHTPRDDLMCQALARMWRENLGARVVLRNQETKTFGEEKARHRFMVARGNWYADYADPTTFLDCLLTGNGNNDSGYSNPAYDALLAEAARETSPTHRAELLRGAERIIVEEDFPVVPILHYSTTIAIQPGVEGLYPNPRMLFPFRYVAPARGRVAPVSNR
jgi:oligopeptide transport system substrate-binding protein